MRQSRFNRWRFGLGAVFLTLCGCPAQGPSPPSETPAPAAGALRVIVVDDPPLAAAIQQQWTARAEGELDLQALTSDELCAPQRRRLAADAVIYPSGLLGELAERGWLEPLSDAALDSPEFARRDIFDHLRQHEIVWGNQVLAVPLGSPPLVLVYRADAFERLGLRPPDTWHEYAALCRRLASSRELLTDLVDPQADWHPVAEPLGPGWAGQTLLARAATYARHRSYFATLFDPTTMEPRIASPPFVKGLEELVAAASFAGPEAVQWTPERIRELLLAGRCLMGMTWPCAARGPENATATAERRVLLAAADLPGSREAFHPGNDEWQPREATESGRITLLNVAGRLGSVVAGSPRISAASSLLVRLSGPEWNRDVSPFSTATTVFRGSQLPDVQAWVGGGFSDASAKAYGELLQETLRHTLTVNSIRLPGRQRYLAALDEAVQAAIRGDRSPADCLNEAADKWRKITEDLGLDNQRRAYWRSLGKSRS